ncbi:MAG: T9SS C-terminal target domain-containing protein [Cryomorphaceae bacterium]|nr:MAG: T9SS C-terminal target domain-containing protein [Cryomorphaceae bacterium]
MKTSKPVRCTEISIFRVVFALLLVCSSASTAFSQCEPEDCLSELPDYGGVCQDETIPGKINEPYFDNISFHITTGCIPGSILDPIYSSASGIVIQMYNPEFTGLPVGITGGFNENSYSPPANGCGFLEGTPQQAGLFLFSVSFQADVQAWLLSTSCGGFLPPATLNGEEISIDVILRILPDASFTGLDTIAYCTTDSARTLISTGTAGGDFSGPGVSGNVFDPAEAGSGLHPIMYSVTAMEGTAVEPETDSLIVWVEVFEPMWYFEDADGDGFGNPEVSVWECFPPEGFVDNDLDCDDTDADIFPGAPNAPDGTIKDCDILASSVSLQLQKVRLYPNPTADRITLAGGAFLGEVFITVFDVSGRMVHSESMIAAGALQHDLQLAHFGKGVYILHIHHKEEAERRRVVVR